MARLKDLPMELILEIASHLCGCRDLAALTATSQRFYGIFNDTLYERDANPTQLPTVYRDGQAISRPPLVQPKALAWAAEHDLLGVAKKALAAGTGVNMRFESPMPMSQRKAVLLARREGRFKDIVQPPERSEKTGEGETMKEDAGGQGHLDAKSADMEYYWTPLHLAAYYGHANLARLLLSAGAALDTLSRGLCGCRTRAFHVPGPRDFDSLHTAGSRDWNPLHTAICMGHDSIVEIFLDATRNADLATKRFVWFRDWHRQSRASEGCSHAMHDAAYQGNVSIMKRLVEYGCIPGPNCGDHDLNVGLKDNDGLLEVYDEVGQTPLVYAFVGKQWDTVEWLINHRVGVNIDVLVFGNSLLMRAVMTRDWPAASRLLDLGACATLRSESCSTSVLHRICVPEHSKTQLASEHQRMDLLHRLLKTGLAVDNTNRRGFTPLMWAAQLPDLSAMDAFIEAGACVQPAGHFTPLLMACHGGQTTSYMVYRLNNDTSTQTQIVLTAIDKLFDAGVEVKTALGVVCHSSSFRLTNEDHLTRCDRTSCKVVEHLLKRGADPNYRKGYDGTALERTLEMNRPDLSDILLDNGADISF